MIASTQVEECLAIAISIEIMHSSKAAEGSVCTNKIDMLSKTREPATAKI